MPSSYLMSIESPTVDMPGPAKQKTFLEFESLPADSAKDKRKAKKAQNKAGTKDKRHDDPSPESSAATTQDSSKTLDDSTVFVIDAHSLIYQVFFAMGEMTSPTGQPVNAVYGFVRDVLDIIEKKKPGYLIAAFDKGAITFRNQLFDQYKANRDPMPDNLRSQIPMIQDMLHALDIPVMEIENYEADDVMATVARQVRERGGRCLLVTSDKDCRQLITPQVRIFNIRKNKIYDETALLNDWGVRPDQVVDFQAMVGDSVDNVPGIPSVGPKTAAKFIEQFGSLEGLIAGVDQLKSKKQQEKIKANIQQARLSRDLVRLDDQVPIETDWEKARIGNIDIQKALELCDQFGFRSLADRIGDLPIAKAPTVWESDYRLVDSITDLQELIDQLKSAPRIAFDTETTSTSPRRAELVGFSICWEEGKAAYIPVMAPKDQTCIELQEALNLVRVILEDDSIEKIGQNLKYDMIVLRQLGVEIKGPIFDTMVADYLLDAGQRNHGIDDLARRYLNHKTIKIKELIGTGKSQKQMNQVDVQLVTDYAAEDVDVPFRLYSLLADRLEAADLGRLFREVEMPLVRVLAEMEFNGIRLDREMLQRLGDEFQENIETLRAGIYQLAGQPFNIDSPQQLANILFDELGLPVVKKTATGRSTAVEVLETLAESHQLPEKIIEYRQFAKLKSTYTDALISLIHPETRRVHTSFMQDVAATGRLSSQDPNLQNIPIRTKTGRQIRRAFIADPEDWRLLSADYSQIELRMLAHFSGDENLLRAFQSDQDIHAAVAARINQVEINQVTSEMRRAAKAVNFGIIYGQTPFGLARSIGIGKDQAADFIDEYFAGYPQVQEFTNRVLTQANRDGQVATILGRKRRIEGVRDPEKVKNKKFLTFAERTAVNTVIQGSAADLIKIAMLNTQEKIVQSGLPIRLLLQIHDELVFEFDPERQTEVVDLVKESMVDAMKLNVPVRVDMEIGINWGVAEAI